jgi:futalosine hydrolase
MHILLCAATETEIAPTLQAMTKEGHRISFLITGVGLMACAYAITKEICTHRPEVILQAGVAGSLTTDQPLGEVVVVRRECVGDLGVAEAGTFRSPFDLNLGNPNAWPWQNGRLDNAEEWLNKTGLPVVDSVTVNQITTSPETIAYYRNELKVQAESMEGAVLHYVALLERLPFLQLRSFSNFIGERDKSKWRLNEAIKNLNRELGRILSTLETA